MNAKIAEVENYACDIQNLVGWCNAHAPMIVEAVPPNRVAVVSYLHNMDRVSIWMSMDADEEAILKALRDLMEAVGRMESRAKL